MTKEQIRIIIGENVRQERMARGMSIDELAEVLELTPGFVGLIERGRRGTTAHTLFRLSEIFEMPIDAILRQNKTAAELKMEEKQTTPQKTKRAKIASLISDLSEHELEFVVNIIKDLRAFSAAVQPKPVEAEGNEEEESDEF